MSDPLYRKELLRLAANAAGAGRLPHPTGSATAANPACGDRVTIDLTLRRGRITGIAHNTLACVLAQASASILGADLQGLGRAEVAALARSVRVMLEGGDAPPPPFDAYAAFDGVAAHAGRHTCVLLPFEAVLAAFDDASEGASESGEPGG